MIQTRIFTMVIALLAAGCASFDPDLDLQSTSITMEEDTSDSSDETSEGSSTSDGDDDPTSNGDGDGDGDGDPTTGDGDGDPTMGGNPAPGEPCDPLLAFNGTSPCEDPQNLDDLYTCAPTKLMPAPNETVWEFRCIEVKDTQGNGYDLGDGCDDDNGAWYNNGEPAGCLNSWCLWNGLESNPDLNEHQNWPADQCGFEQDGTLVKGCCSAYCDADNPCQFGWTCSPLAQQNISIETDIGVCVWNG